MRLFTRDTLVVIESEQGMSAVRFIWSADRDGVQLLAGAKLGRIEGYRWNPDPRGYRLGSRPFAANSQFAAGARGKAADRPARMCEAPA